MKHKYLPILILFILQNAFDAKAFDRDTMYICKGDCINYFSTTTQGVAVAWDWTFQGASTTTSNQQNPAGICYPNAGFFLTSIKTTFDDNSDSTDTIIIAVQDDFDHNFFWVDDTGFCQGVTPNIWLTTTSAYGIEYNWSTGSNFSSISVNTPGTYWVDLVIRSDYGVCDSLRKVVNITSYTSPSAYLGQDKFMCQGQIFTLDAGAGPNYTYSWSPNNEITRTIDVTQIGVYSVVVTNEYGCTATDEIEFLDSCPHYVFVPNAVSPNEDRLNDLFVKTWNFTPKEYTFSIFNRWGELLWESNDINAGWDCKFNGVPVQQDIYCYKITYLDNDKKWYELRGTFYVVR